MIKKWVSGNMNVEKKLDCHVLNSLLISFELVVYLFIADSSLFTKEFLHKL